MKSENHSMTQEVGRLADIILVLQRCFMRNLSERLAPGRVSFPQYFLLAHIAATDHVSMGEIAGIMRHSTPAATGLVSRLEVLGYVRRESSLSDRRKIMVAITHKGGRLVSTIRQDIVNNLGLLMEQLTETERRAWLRIYEKIYGHCARKPKPQS